MELDMSAENTPSQRRGLVANLINSWRSGIRPDAKQCITEFDWLRDDKSAVIDLAYEEYCLRTEAGESIDTSQFCGLFSSVFQESLYRRIDVHCMISEDLQPEYGLEDELIPGFEIVRQIGRGSFAVVYEALELRLGMRRVVLKVTSLGDREARILGQLDHVGIMPVHSVFDIPDGRSAICMPFLGTETLGNTIRRIGPLPVSTALRFAIGIAIALEHAHSRHVLHLDLKPHNILIDENDHPVLMDFNLASDRLTKHSHVGGTLHYMAPEQLKSLVLKHGKVRALSEKSDVYSFGVMLFEMIMGHRPFECTDVMADSFEQARILVQQQLSSERVVNLLHRHTTHAVSSVISRCLSYSPEDRYRTVGELLVDLNRQFSITARIGRWLNRKPSPPVPNNLCSNHPTIKIQDHGNKP